MSSENPKVQKLAISDLSREYRKVLLQKLGDKLRDAPEEDREALLLAISFVGSTFN